MMFTTIDARFVGGGLTLATMLGSTPSFAEECTLSQLITRPLSAGFGKALDLDGDTLVVGATGGGTNGAGEARVFVRSGATWSEAQIIPNPEPNNGDEFGTSVSVSGGVIVVGDYMGDGLAANSGTAYVYTHNGTTYVYSQELVSSEGGGTEKFGGAVAIDGERMIIGADENGSAGAVFAGAAYVFEYNGTSWTETAVLYSPEPGDTHRFGSAVAISGDRIIIAEPQKDYPIDFYGVAHIFAFDGASWNYEDTVVGSGSMEGDDFGTAVDIQGNRAVVGSPDEHYGAEIFGGAVYVFDRTLSVWSQTARIVPLDIGTAENAFDFGKSVALDDGVILAGASDTILEDPDCDPEFCDYVHHGAGYEFHISGTTWQQVRRYVPNNLDSEDWFGYATALDSPVRAFGTDAVERVTVYFELPENDCNENGRSDACDIEEGASSDLNTNEVPDECEEQPCDGDANGDGVVDPLDSGFVQSRFSCGVGSGDSACDAADVNVDAVVDPLDVGYVLARFGGCE